MRTLLFLLSLLWVRQAAATDNHVYRADEYAVISGGQSPDGRWSVAAHGDGEYGYDHFDLYLMREPAHAKVAPLGTGENLDTAPLSIVALWAPDSGHVVVLYRSDRRVLELRLFGVADGKLRPIEVPTLASAVGQEHFKPEVKYELSGRFYRVAWQKPDRLSVEEFATFEAAQPVFSAGLEKYLEVKRLNPERTWTHFSAQALWEIKGEEKPRLSNVKPQRRWPKSIVYSPHLLFDSENGLHSTEITASSLGIPIGQ